MSEHEEPTSKEQFTDLPELIQGASAYSSFDDLWVITCYFNPSKYQTKFNNFCKFENSFRKSGINLITIECAFGDSDFELQEVPKILRIRSPHVLWQKERLINIAITKLPPYVRKVAWVDCDILFSNPDWLLETAALLNKYLAVQPFQTAIRLPQGHEQYVGRGELWKSFGYKVSKEPEVVFRGDFHQHGHTGFAWAAQRDLVEKHGLYDAFIGGSGDHFIAHAMCGDFSSACFNRLPLSIHQENHFLQWGKNFHNDVRGKISYSTGEVLHLWHGETENRNYVQRHVELTNFDFNPLLDLAIGDNGAWQWNTNKSNLHEWALKYFYYRKEDGET